MPADHGRRIQHAEILSIGSELLVGETRDTNAGELAASITREGVAVTRITAVPDRLEAVRDAFASGLERADLVLSTGGLGPTPDDLTREAIAEVCGETPVIDPGSERWLRGLWARRGLPFPESNRKQAWLIPSAVALHNPNGTAPGWFVDRPVGVIVALPGPPREMLPMWHDHVLPRLRDRGLGADTAAITFRLTGIGESQVAEILGDELLRQPNPEVATYARAQAVDIRVSAVGFGGTDAAGLVAGVAAMIRERLGRHIWAEGDVTWSGAIGARLRERGWRLAIAELGTRGQFAALLGDVDWVVLDEIRIDPPAVHDDELGQTPGSTDDGPLTDHASGLAARLLDEARAIRTRSGAEVGMAMAVNERGDDTKVTLAIVTPTREHVERRTAFLGGANGRTRAALASAAGLLAVLRSDP